MLGFACIRDCSVCPFSCNRGFDVRISTNSQINKNLPDGLVKPVEEKSQTTEMEMKSAAIPVEKTETKAETNETKENLPVLAEVQYTIKESEKKGLFGWRKNK